MSLALPLLLVLAGCGSTPQAPPPMADGWPAELALRPGSFTELTAADREGWIAVHAHRYADARTGPAGDRARQAEAVLALDLTRLGGEAVARLAQATEARGPVPDGLAFVAARGARCTGVGDPAKWAGRFTTPELVARLEAPPGDPGLAVWTDPDSAGGFQRRYFDPCPAAPVPDGAWKPSGDGLAAVVFSGWLTPATLPRDVARYEDLGAADPPGFPLPPLGETDDAEAARGAVHALDTVLARWREGLLAAAGDEGRSLLVDLAAMERFRQEFLVDRGRWLLARDRPHQALVTLEQAVDPLADGGPTDDPDLWVLLARARLQTGRTREALDALAHLRKGTNLPLTAATETIADLAVLQGMDRTGESHEQ